MKGAEDAGVHAAQSASSACRCWCSTTARRSPSPWPSAAISRRRSPSRRCSARAPRQRAIVEMWNRRVEMDLLACVAQAFRHLHPAAAQLEVPQVAAWGEANKPRAQEMLQTHRRGARQAPLHRRRRLFGGRHHRAGGGRLHASRRGWSGRKASKPRALAPGGVGAAEREGLSVRRRAAGVACSLGNRQTGPTCPRLRDDASHREDVP